jgi:hypothetical protein
MNYDPASDLRALEAMAANLTPYLYEKDLYGVISNDLPRLTVGGLLMRLHRLESLRDSLEENQRQRLHDARMNFEQLRAEWRSHYEDKIGQELEARLNNYNAFLNDYDESDQRGRSLYPAEATHRTIIERLKREAEVLDFWDELDVEDRLNRLDRRLKQDLDEEHEKFLWADELKPVYPKNEYWWLYSMPEVED